MLGRDQKSKYAPEPLRRRYSNFCRQGESKLIESFDLKAMTKKIEAAPCKIQGSSLSYKLPKMNLRQPKIQRVLLAWEEDIAPWSQQEQRERDT